MHAGPCYADIYIATLRRCANLPASARCRERGLPFVGGLHLRVLRLAGAAICRWGMPPRARTQDDAPRILFLKIDGDIADAAAILYTHLPSSSRARHWPCHDVADHERGFARPALLCVKSRQRLLFS